MERALGMGSSESIWLAKWQLALTVKREVDQIRHQCKIVVQAELDLTDSSGSGQAYCCIPTTHGIAMNIFLLCYGMPKILITS